MSELIRPLPADVTEFTEWEWGQIEPYYARLRAVPLDAQNVHSWLADWSQLASLIDESYWRLYIRTTQNTADTATEARFNRYVEEIYPHYQTSEQALKEKLLASALTPRGMEIPLRNLRAEAELFRANNLPLHTQERKLENEYDRISGAQVIVWEGQVRTPAQMLRVFHDADHATRERAWRMVHGRQLQDRAVLNDLWQRMLQLRLQMAKNADLLLPQNGHGAVGDYRALRWKQMQRFDYTPTDCKRFADAIEEVVVPAAKRRYEKHRKRLGVDTLRPWDLQGPQGMFAPVTPDGVEPLRPFASTGELIAKSSAIFRRLDPTLGDYFDLMRDENLLDLTNRVNKAPGGYCLNLEYSKRPFIFMNAVGTHDDVQTLLHESGHAFHAFESFHLPYIAQRASPLEFCEVASTAMELMSAPYLNQPDGFYGDGIAARARADRLETSILFWPYMAVVDLFQHWAYESPNDAADPENCDDKWGELWDRFMVGVDWSGLDQERVTGWHRKPHIFTGTLYYVEYGIAQLGAVQVWANSLRDPAEALRAYRRALARGATATLPELFQTAGARFRFDAATLREAVALLENSIAELEE